MSLKWRTWELLGRYCGLRSSYDVIWSVCTCLERPISEKNLDKFGMKNLKLVSTPLPSHYKLSDEHFPNIVEEQSYKCWG